MKKAFTLIKFLVVIAIIGVLATVAIMGTMALGSRDTKRIADGRDLQSGSAPVSFACGEPVNFKYMGSSVSYGTVVGAGNRCWMDQNLGASHIATSSDDSLAFGNLFQWGRPADGHQVRTSGTWSPQVDTLTPGTTTFIIPSADWTTVDNPSGATRELSWGVNGTPSPCPAGWHVPTYDEWEAERQGWTSGNNSAGAFASSLKLTVAGFRDSSKGSLSSVGSNGFYWSSSVDGIRSRSLNFSSGNASMSSGNRANGFTVRCIKDL